MPQSIRIAARTGSVGQNSAGEPDDKDHKTNCRRANPGGLGCRHAPNAENGS